MIAWTDAHQRAAVLASQVHADLSIDLSKPVDVFAAAEQLGLVLAFTELGPTSGIYIPGGRSSGILIHSGHPRTRQRYTAGHELGHHMFGHALERDMDLEGELRRNMEGFPDHEKEAEAFGAWFLMPRRLMRCGPRRTEHRHGSRSPFDVYSLSLWLGNQLHRDRTPARNDPPHHERSSRSVGPDRSEESEIRARRTPRPR